MKIKEILKDRRTVSFEFYPPKAEDGIPGVFRAVDRLKEFAPNFISVTYGAGGGTRTFTERIAVGVQKESDITVMAHVTCSSQTREQVHEVLERLQEAGIENLIALRGDPPRDQEKFVPVENGFAHATDLMRYIRDNFDFSMAGACYPEGHPESPNLDSDIEFTKKKVDEGADFLSTQLFYDNNDFYDFVNRARQVGISVPIIAGVLPVISGPQIRRFTKLSNSKIPPDMDKELDRLGEDNKAVREYGIEYATKQVADLWENGVQGVHFFALNRSYSIAKILRNLKLPSHEGLTLSSTEA